MRKQVVIKRALASAGHSLQQINEHAAKRQFPGIIKKVNAGHPYCLTNAQNDGNPVILISLSNLANLIEMIMDKQSPSIDFLSVNSSESQS